MPRRKSRRKTRRSSSKGLGTYMRQPLVQVAIVLLVAFIIYIIASAGGGGSQGASSLPASVSVDEAYQMYTEGTFVLDVRTVAEWNEYHAPNTTLIPLDELSARVNELPKDQPIVVVCRSGNRSQTGRDILLGAGFNATSMTGGLNAWRDSGYPTVNGP